MFAGDAAAGPGDRRGSRPMRSACSSAAGSDLTVVEACAGIGQSDTEIVDLVDAPCTVNDEHEYGAASWLEKIDMLDLRLIALNRIRETRRGGCAA